MVIKCHNVSGSVVLSQSTVKSSASRFRGRSDHSLDAKGRLNVPARFRDVLLRHYDERLMITPPWHNCIRVYHFQEWEKRETALLEMENKPPHIVRMVRYLIGGINEGHIDKNGRILLPAQLRTQLNIKKKVVMNGMLDFFEIWDWETWESESIPSAEDYTVYDQTFNDLGMY